MALKSNEVRSGNLVYGHNGKVTVVTGYNILSLEDLEKGLHHDPRYKDWKGIPLDEEWLKKLGFDWKIDIHRWVNDIGFEIQQFTAFDNHFVSCYTKPPLKEIQLKHVHHLQNLYHSLTGSELEIKE